MLDLKLLRNSPEEVAHCLKRRGYEFDLIKWSDLENKRKSLQSDTEGLQAQLNTISKKIGELKRSKQDSLKIKVLN